LFFIINKIIRNYQKSKIYFEPYNVGYDPISALTKNPAYTYTPPNGRCSVTEH
jgi:hypothetical protein